MKEKENIIYINITYRYFTLLLLLSFLSNSAIASPLKDFYINQALERYFTLPEDAETLSMAGSNATNCNSSNCIYLNPAGLGQLERYQFSSTLGTSQISGDFFPTSESIRQEQYLADAVLAIPFGKANSKRSKYGTFALGFSRYYGHTNDEIKTSPDGFRRSIAYGYSPTENFSLGYSFTFYDDQLRSKFADLHSHSRLLHSWGIQLRPVKDLEISSVFNLGIGQSDTEDFRFSSDGLSHLREYSGGLGIAKKLERTTLALSVDYTKVKSRGTLTQVALPVVIGGSEEGNVFNLRLGASRKLNRHLITRIGVRFQNVENYKFQRSDLANLSGDIRSLGWSGGFGYLFGKKKVDEENQISLDYGLEFLDIANGSWQHLITLKVPFS